ncbi:hypothetical protein T492DRAFT_1141575 [Pavlovales sp. CCMP2436]|nr:hypothetical protein T492DRAFT_1141575 [Pavlovales sp. CCMP2436]
MPLKRPTAPTDAPKALETQDLANADAPMTLTHSELKAIAADDEAHAQDNMTEEMDVDAQHAETTDTGGAHDDHLVPLVDKATVTDAALADSLAETERVVELNDDGSEPRAQLPADAVSADAAKQPSAPALEAAPAQRAQLPADAVSADAAKQPSAPALEAAPAQRGFVPPKKKAAAPGFNSPMQSGAALAALTAAAGGKAAEADAPSKPRKAVAPKEKKRASRDDDDDAAEAGGTEKADGDGDGGDDDDEEMPSKSKRRTQMEDKSANAARRSEKRARKEAKADAKSTKANKATGDPKPKSAAQKRRDKEETGVPKNARSAYLYFLASQTEALRAAAPDKKFSVTENAKVLGAAWKTFNTPGPKSPAKTPVVASQRSPNAPRVARRLQPAPSAESAELAEPEAAYHALVSDPICLREIEAKLEKGDYLDALADFTRDVDTLIDNAFVANGEDTLVFHQARELGKEWTRVQEARAELVHA